MPDKYKTIDQANFELTQKKDLAKKITKPLKAAFLALMDELSADLNKQSVINTEKQISLLRVGRRADRDGLRSEYFKLNFEGKDYFVKKIYKNFSRYGGGSQEVEGMQVAKELLKDYPWIEIPDYQLGYFDGKNSYLISSWNPALEIDLEQYLKYKIPKTEKNWKTVHEIKKRVGLVSERLEYKFSDLEDYNISYDPKTDKLILFDLKYLKKPIKNFQTSK